jgi:hypothetical protein
MARGRPARAVLRRASLSDGGETSRRAPFSESRKSRDRFRASSNFTNERIDDDYASFERASHLLTYSSASSSSVSRNRTNASMFRFWSSRYRTHISMREVIPDASFSSKA